jgi:hypothetical protein
MKLQIALLLAFGGIGAQAFATDETRASRGRTTPPLT